MKLMELYKEKVMGAIKGLDRIRFRGTLRLLACIASDGIGHFLKFC
jgi:malate/lactate dehydrogenase